MKISKLFSLIGLSSVLLPSTSCLFSCSKKTELDKIEIIYNSPTVNALSGVAGSITLGLYVSPSTVDTSVNWSVSGNDITNLITISNDGVLSWTNNLAPNKSYNLLIKATSVAYPDVYGLKNLSIIASSPKLDITCKSSQIIGYMADPGDVQFTASVKNYGIVNDVKWSLSDDAPAWLKINQQGVLSWPADNKDLGIQQFQVNAMIEGIESSKTTLDTKICIVNGRPTSIEIIPEVPLDNFTMPTEKQEEIQFTAVIMPASCQTYSIWSAECDNPFIDLIIDQNTGLLKITAYDEIKEVNVTVSVIDITKTVYDHLSFKVEVKNQ